MGLTLKYALFAIYVYMYTNYVDKMSVFSDSDRRFKPKRHQYFVPLSKTLNHIASVIGTPS